MTPTEEPNQPRTARLLLRRVGPGRVRAATAVLPGPGATRRNQAGPPFAEQATARLRPITDPGVVRAVRRQEATMDT